MKVLNLYFSSTGNTEKVALKIDETVQELGHSVDTIKISSKEHSLDILNYDFVFVGSGVYGQLPGKSLMDLQRGLIQSYVKAGEINPTSPRRPPLPTWSPTAPTGVFTRASMRRFQPSSLWDSSLIIWGSPLLESGMWWVNTIRRNFEAIPWAAAWGTYGEDRTRRIWKKSLKK